MCNRKVAPAVLRAGLVASSGCASSGGLGTAATTAPADDTAARSTGTVQLHVSDQPATIDGFEHLTVTPIVLGRTDSAGGGTATDGVETDDESTRQQDGLDENETATGPAGRLPNGRPDPGKKATTRRSSAARRFLPAYATAFVHVGSIDATLRNGESVRTKLPSSTLQFNAGFELEPNGTVEFVYDTAVLDAGNGGKHTLKPVLGESGTDRDIGRTDDRGPGEDEPEAEERKAVTEATATEEQETATAATG